MLTKTPFLPGFSTLLFGSSKKKKQEILQARQREIQGKDYGELSLQLAEEIPSELIAQFEGRKRNRVYSFGITFWGFLGQIFSEDGSCAAAVTCIQQIKRAAGLPIPSSKTTSYVDARKELPVDMFDAVHHHVSDQLEAHAGDSCRWRGYRVLCVDGTSVLAPDTGPNQVKFPQPSSQQPGCGFPTVHMVGLIDLGHGGLIDFSIGNYKTSELRGFEAMEGNLGENDLVVGDRLFSNYELVARLHSKGIPFVGRNHQSRKMDFRKGKKLGKNERLIRWEKPRSQPPGSAATKEEWDALPDFIDIRVIRTEGLNRKGKLKKRYVVTTLTDPEEYPAEEVASLYHHRWEIELRFRDIKTTMGMEMLRTKSPKMLIKELKMHVIAYNVIKLLMLKAGQEYGVSHRRIGFKAVIQVLDKCRCGFHKLAGRAKKLLEERSNMIARIAERVIPFRPGRNEPRKKKRRPKSYGWLQKPRHRYFEHFRTDFDPLRILDNVS